LKTQALACIVVLAASALAGCGSDSSNAASGNDLPTLTFGAFPGTQSIPLFAIKDQKLDVKHGFNLKIKSFQTPPALNSAIVSGAVQAGFGSVTGMATARSQGRDVLIINGLMTTSEVVLAPKDSSINSMADVNGKKMGAFGGTTTGAFSVLAAAVKGRGEVDDLGSDVKIVDAPDAAMLGLLDKGELQAALPTLAGAIPAILSNKYKVLADLREEYKKAYGAAPATVMVTTTDKFAKGHAELLKDFNAALKDGINYVVSTPAVWDDFAKSVKVTQPGAADLWRKMVGGAYLPTWDENSVKTETQFLEQARDILGVEKTFEKVPDGLFSTDYVSP
jgi:ABC-type nitrate/sulfonate/bicarbonate transport system substrate-binding protein